MAAVWPLKRLGKGHPYPLAIGLTIAVPLSDFQAHAPGHLQKQRPWLLAFWGTVLLSLAFGIEVGGVGLELAPVQRCPVVEGV